MRRLPRALVFIAVAVSFVRGGPLQAQSVCRPANANTAVLIKWLGIYTSATSGDNLASREMLRLPSVPTKQLTVVTHEATCKKAKTTYEATVRPEGGTGFSGRVYVIKAGTVFVVLDPSYHYGPDPGWWRIVTMDSRYRTLSGTTTQGIS